MNHKTIHAALSSIENDFNDINAVARAHRQEEATARKEKIALVK